MARNQKYMESLLPELVGVDFIEHYRYISEKVTYWKQHIKDEQISDICSNLYM